MTARTDARIIDRGYRRYEGPRLGTRGASMALWKATIQDALGLRRKFRHKIVPLLTAVFAYLPAIVFVGAAALLGKDAIGAIEADYSDYYGFVTAAILLYVAVVVPGVICPDRRTGMLGMYLAAPLSRNRYVVFKALGVLTVLLIVTFGPPLLLLIGYSLVEVGPSWPLDGLGVLAQIVAASVAVAVWFGVLGFVASTTTDRRGFATAGIAIVTLVSTAMVETVVNVTDTTDYVRLLDLFTLPFHMVARIYGEEQGTPAAGIATPALFAAFAAWILAGCAYVWWRYQRLTVTK